MLKETRPSVVVTGTGLFQNFTYHGGPVINTPQLYLLFIGDWSSITNQTRASRLGRFVADLLDSRFMNILSQYGCGTTGRVISHRFIPNTNHNLSGGDIHNILQTAISNNQIAEPTNPSSAYLLFLDDATGVDDRGDNVVLCEATNDNAFGFHEFFTTRRGNVCYFAVIPSLNDACLKKSCTSGDSTCSLHLAQSQEQRQTQVTSHELAEMLSDPKLNAWYDPTPFGGECGDICNGQSTTITVGFNTWTVQRIYSKWHDMNTNGHTYCLSDTPNPLPSMLPSVTV